MKPMDPEPDNYKLGSYIPTILCKVRKGLLL